MRTSRRGCQSERKIKKRSALSGILAKLKDQGKKIVFTNGCFDLLHYGHVRYLEEAKKKGDILVVALNSDASVRKIKGRKRPLVPLGDRLRIIAALESVDYVTYFAEYTPLKTIELLKPDVLVKGADWQRDKIVGGNLVLGYGGKVSRVTYSKGRSSASLIRKIVQLY